MSPASEMPINEGDGGRSVPTRPFIPGRETGRVPAQTRGSSFPRPFRTGGGPARAAASVQNESESEHPGWTENLGGLPEVELGEVAQTGSPADSGNEPLPLPVEAEQEAELVPEADFAPLVSWDPLADVGWRAGPAESEPENPDEPPARLRTSDPVAVGPNGDFIPLSTASVESAIEGTHSGQDEFASKLEAIAAAIRRDRVEELLAEHPQDALTALVTGYYIGTSRQRGGGGGG